MSIDSDNKNYLHKLLNEGKLIPIDDTEVDINKIEFPPWYDEKLFKKGQKCCTQNIFAMFVGMMCGLIAVLAIPSILSVLMCTKKSSTNTTAYRRYLRTIFITVTWNWYNFESTKPINKTSYAWQSLIAVRKTHFNASKSCCTKTKNTLFISQCDMALTQFGFMGYITLKANLLGLNEQDEEFLNAIVHFWRVIGYLLGIKDEYNLCTDNWSTTKQRLELVNENIFKPNLVNVNENFINMTTALIDGLWSFSPMLSVKTYLFFTRRLSGCNGYQYFPNEYLNNTDNQNKQEIKLYKLLPIYNRFTLGFLIYTLQILYKYRIFKWYFDFQIYLSLFIIYWFPFLAFHRFGFQKSYVRISYNQK